MKEYVPSYADISRFLEMLDFPQPFQVSHTRACMTVFLFYVRDNSQLKTKKNNQAIDNVILYGEKTSSLISFITVRREYAQKVTIKFHQTKCIL